MIDESSVHAKFVRLQRIVERLEIAQLNLQDRADLVTTALRLHRELTARISGLTQKVRVVKREPSGQFVERQFAPGEEQ